jgi:hypothetical protein
MVTASIEPFLKGSMGRNTRGLLRVIILILIAAAAVASRLFSVISKGFVNSAAVTETYEYISLLTKYLSQDSRA